MMRLFAFLLLVAFLAACQSAPPTGAPTAVPTRVAAVATNTIPPSATVTSQPTATPTDTPLSTSTPTTVATSAPAPTATPTNTPTPAAREVYVNSNNGLNLRADPSSTAAVLRTLDPGTPLTAIDAANPPDASGIAWQNVRTDDGQSGWVAAQYLVDTKPVAAVPTATPLPTLSPDATPVVTPIAASGYVYVAASDGLNLRADKSAAAQLLATLANGQRLQTNGLGFGPDADGITWLNVKTDGGQEGWVSAAFVTDQVPSVATPAPIANDSGTAAEILRRTNELRQQNNLPPLILNDDLNRLALSHSQYMAQNGITHSDAGGLSPRQRITNAGYGSPYASENIFGGQASVDDAWQYWSTDPPHLQNLLTSYNNVVGIGVYQTGFMIYYTMDFGKPAGAP
ncbi:MAG TPA: SH3 domain-containing protein [Anaerolineae bacterium]|nr:SH3 domain-containing protein [Anaerolineae bacterium]